MYIYIYNYNIFNHVYIDPFHLVSNDVNCSLKLKLFVVRHLGAQVTVGRYAWAEQSFWLLLHVPVSDYGFGFIFLVLFFYSGH